MSLGTCHECHWFQRVRLDSASSGFREFRIGLSIFRAHSRSFRCTFIPHSICSIHKLSPFIWYNIFSFSVFNFFHIVQIQSTLSSVGTHIHHANFVLMAVLYPRNSSMHQKTIHSPSMGFFYLSGRSLSGVITVQNSGVATVVLRKGPVQHCRRHCCSLEQFIVPCWPPVRIDSPGEDRTTAHRHCDDSFEPTIDNCTWSWPDHETRLERKEVTHTIHEPKAETVV